jgi:glycosyltransferase involved in cell wall biosynthesis
MARVSVVLNCFNGEAYLREAIDSVYAQTYRDWEIIFWDDASTDGSPVIAADYDAKLKYYKGEKATSLGQARNQALKKTKGTYVAFLDQDDIWVNTKLEKQVTLLDTQPRVSLVYTNYFRLTPDGRMKSALKGEQPSGAVFERFLFHYPVGMSTAMIRKSAIDELEMRFDETLNVAEEFDLFMRILSRSTAAYLVEPLAMYRVHGNMTSIRFMDRYPVEIAYIMKRLQKTVPFFEDRYGKASRYMTAKIGYWRARASLAKGQASEARNALRPYRWTDPTFFLLYLTTYFPSGVWHFLHRWRGRGFSI